MGRCNLKNSSDCYGCGYYGSGDSEGCKLTIAFHKMKPQHTDEEYRQYMISHGRKEL